MSKQRGKHRVMGNDDLGREQLERVNVRLIGIAMTFAALWLLMSGLYKPMLLGFGAVSVALTVYVIYRMDRVDQDRVQISLNPFAGVMYFFWLLTEIARANWAVTKLILSPTLHTRQHLFRVPYTQKTDLGRTVFANSITLTPGTISVETEHGDFLIHAVNYSDDDIVALADMDARVSATESGAARLEDEGAV